MSVVARRRARGTTFYVVTRHEGHSYWERSGTERRAAERLDARRKREVRNGTYVPPSASGALTVAGYAKRWLARRSNRTVRDDRQRLRDHVLNRQWFADLRLEHVSVRHVRRLVDELNQGDLAHKTLVNILDVNKVLPPYFGSTCGGPDYAERQDLDANCVINILDVNKVLPPTFGSVCAP